MADAGLVGPQRVANAGRARNTGPPFQLKRSSAENLSGSTQSAKTRDRNSSVSGIDLDGSTKRTLDAVSSKLDGISGKPAESSKRFSVLDLKKTFGSKPQANDELAETSGYHSDSTQNVDVKTLRSRFERPSNASIIVEQSKLSSDAKPKETEKALSRSNSFGKQ